jgi:hypothetical protein
MGNPIRSDRPRVKRGFVKVGQQFLQNESTNLTDAEYRLLILLHSFKFENSSNPVIPGRELLAKRCGWSTRKVSRVWESLEAKKAIKRVSRPGRSNELRLTLDIYDPTLDTSVNTTLDTTVKGPLTPVSTEEEEGNKRGGDGGSGGDLELSLIANSSSPPVTAFDRFWKAYPRKRGKKAALKAWKNLKPNQGLVEIILKAVEAGKANGWDDPQFIPYPATWLNRGQWEDEHEGKAKSGYKFDPKYCGR